MINKQYLFYLYIVYILFFITPQFSFATTFQSPRYRIETNTQIENSSSNSSLVSGTFATKGYIISSRQDANPFTITLSQNTIDLGKTDATHTIFTKQLTMTINSARYTIMTFKPERFFNFDTSSFIPDTRCDEKKQICTNSTAAPWRSSSEYGFGYTIAGKNAPHDFENGTRFRPFSPYPIALFSSDIPQTAHNYLFILKAVVPVDQPSGTYSTTIHIIALAHF